jgi:hypothetical protein
MEGTHSHQGKYAMSTRSLLASYQPVQEIPVARCCTVWTDYLTDSMENYLLVEDQMLWFGRHCCPIR